MTPEEFDAAGFDAVFDFLVGTKATPPGVTLRVRYGGMAQALSGQGKSDQVNLILTEEQAELLLKRLSQILRKEQQH